MSTDFTKIQRVSSASSNKILLEGSGSFIVPALPGAGDTFGSATIAHNFASDYLIYQVGISGNTVGNVIDPVMLPWSSNDNRRIAYAYIDDSSLHVVCISSDASGFGNSSFTVNYEYRLLIP